MSTRIDTVIRGGTIADGTGGDLFEADVAIHDGMIAAVGKRLSLQGKEEIDARGLLVTPGFVDIHTHYDAQVTSEHRLSPSSDHGVTTVLMGNCAIGVAPCRPEHRDLLVSVIAGVEDIPEAVMLAGLEWRWESYPQYLDLLSKRQCDMDFASQIAHSAIRVYVMGQRGADREPARAADLAAMTALVHEAINAGALGVSTSRTLSHRTMQGALAPAETSSEDELLALARGLKQAQSGVFELISDFPDLELGGTSHFDLLRRIVRESGERMLSFTVVQNPMEIGGWRRLLELIEQANAEGLPIKGQVAPRAVGMLFGHDLSFNPFSFRPSYKAVAQLPLASRLHSGPDIFFTPQYGGHWVITRFKDLKAIFDDRDTRTCTHGLAHRALLEARSMRIRVRVFARHAHRHLHADRGIARGGSSAVVAMGRRQGAQSRRECPARGIERHDRLCAATGSRAPASSQ